MKMCKDLFFCSGKSHMKAVGILDLIQIFVPDCLFPCRREPVYGAGGLDQGLLDWWIDGSAL
jgi:hypothetical protein